MDLKINGTVTQILEEASGEGKNGTWRKQEFILETDGNYPKQICMVMWGDNIDKFGISENEKLTAHIDIASREYNSRWYTDIKAWKVERESGGGGQSGPPAHADEPFPEPPETSDDDDGLPF
jgi:hypothetical protein